MGSIHISHLQCVVRPKRTSFQKCWRSTTVPWDPQLYIFGNAGQMSIHKTRQQGNGGWEVTKFLQGDLKFRPYKSAFVK
jgi:hypothetical protein